MASDKQIAAFFDVDHTLVAKWSMEKLFILFLLRKRYFQISDLTRYFARRVRARLAGQITDGNKYHFKNKNSHELDRLAAECFRSAIKTRVSRKGLRIVENHRRMGHLIILVTGSLMPLALEMQREIAADMVIAATLAQKDGLLLGTLANQLPYGPEKARLVRELAKDHGIDLTRSFAYGNHHSDIDRKSTRLNSSHYS